ncbi:hypothetical protein [Leptodesmis sp.]|uniref:hypothetical protein n=1 Tax=Leptodesmis sp. TaxID=3100501 RepID=UPI004053480B
MFTESTIQNRKSKILVMGKQFWLSNCSNKDEFIKDEFIRLSDSVLESSVH